MSILSSPPSLLFSSQEAMSDYLPPPHASKSFTKDLKIEEAKMEYLPPEILIEIVLRLPIKSIITWTSVSKSWNSLIKNPNFISTHLNYNHNHTHLLLLRKLSELLSRKLRESIWDGTAIAIGEKEVYSLHWDNEAFHEYTRFDFPFHNPRGPLIFHLVGVCNGLVCLADDFQNSCNFFVWNPCIRKYVALPDPIFHSHSLFGTCCGFGFDSKTSDYKVVRFLNVWHKANRNPVWIEHEAKVYSLATGKWKTVRVDPPICVMRSHDPQAFVNGALHWASGGMMNGKYRLYVSVFDLGDDNFRQIMLPNDSDIEDDESFHMSVSVCGESLAVFTRTDEDSCFHVWVMKEYGVLESWTKVFTFSSKGLEFEVPRALDLLLDEGEELNPLCFRKSGEVVIETEKGKLVSLDSECKKIKDLGLRNLFYNFNFVDPYVESLVLLDNSEGAVSY